MKYIPMALCLMLAFVAVVEEPNQRKGGKVSHVVVAVVGPLNNIIMHARVHSSHVEYSAWMDACSKASAEDAPRLPTTSPHLHAR